MLPLQLGLDRKRLRVLCLGAHSDDIEIGCAGTLLRWLQEYQRIEIAWAVMSAAGPRGSEAKRSARSLMRRAARLDLHLGDFTDAALPADFGRAKSFFASLRNSTQPDVVLTHRLDDRHQDHRLVAELTWQTWRSHLILEYEIPKYEGDLGQPNVFVPLTPSIVERKVRHLWGHFGSQRDKDWFTPETFRSLLHLRGIECRSPTGVAEGFQARKLTI